MKDELKGLLKELSPSEFDKVKQLYKMTNKIEGNTIDEFVGNIASDRTVEGVIKLCKKQLGRA